MLQIAVFLAQIKQVFVCNGILGIDRRNGTWLKQSCLPKEYRLDLEQTVAMLRYRAKRNGVCPPFEGVAIDAKAEVASESNEERVLPILVADLTTLHYLFRALLETFHLQG